MNLIRLLTVALSLTVGLAEPLWAQRADVLPPQRRAETVNAAEAFVAIKSPEALPPALNNPFAPEAFFRVSTPVENVPVAAPVVATVRQPTSDDELLAQIAPAITPSGTLIMGGRALLLFGQKRVKVGDSLPITFQGEPYTLVITEIMPTSFTLRLNNAQLTRPINAGN